MDGREWPRFVKIGSGLLRLVQFGLVWLGFGQIGSDWPSLVQIAQIGLDWRSFAQICLDWPRLALIGSDHSLRSDLLGLAQIDSDCIRFSFIGSDCSDCLRLAQIVSDLSRFAFIETDLP